MSTTDNTSKGIISTVTSYFTTPTKKKEDKSDDINDEEVTRVLDFGESKQPDDKTLKERYAALKKLYADLKLPRDLVAADRNKALDVLAAREPSRTAKGARDYTQYTADVKPGLEAFWIRKNYTIKETLEILSTIAKEERFKYVRVAIMKLTYQGGAPKPGEKWLSIPYHFGDGTNRAKMIDCYARLTGLFQGKYSVLTAAKFTVDTKAIELDVELEDKVIADLMLEKTVKDQKEQIAAKVQKGEIKISDDLVNKQARAMAERLQLPPIDIAAELGLTTQIQQIQRLQKYYDNPILVANSFNRELDELKNKVNRTMRAKYLQNLFVAVKDGQESELIPSKITFGEKLEDQTIYYDGKNVEEHLHSGVPTIRARKDCDAEKIKKLLREQRDRLLSDGEKQLRRNYYEF